MILAFPCRYVAFRIGIIFHVTFGTTGRIHGEALFALFALLLAIPARAEVSDGGCPSNTACRIVAFMNLAGTVKKQPASWKDLFFPTAHGLAGN